MNLKFTKISWKMTTLLQPQFTTQQRISLKFSHPRKCISISHPIYLHTVRFGEFFASNCSYFACCLLFAFQVEKQFFIYFRLPLTLSTHKLHRRSLIRGKCAFFTFLDFYFFLKYKYDSRNVCAVFWYSVAVEKEKGLILLPHNSPCAFLHTNSFPFLFFLASIWEKREHCRILIYELRRKKRKFWRYLKL
jgi:hypothetical protein